MTDPRLLRRGSLILGAILVASLVPAAAIAQAIGVPPVPPPAADAGGAAGLLPGLDGLAGGVGRNAALLVLVMTALSLAPGLAIAVTCFPFIVTVLSILRQSIGLPQSPPNMLIVVLSLFLSWFVMDPVLREAWASAGKPLQDGSIGVTEALQRGIIPFRGFMEARTDPDTLAALQEVAPRPGGGAGPGAAPAPGLGGDGGMPAAGSADSADSAAVGSATPVPTAVSGAPLSVLIPSFMLSEVQRAFEVGFLIALPFLIIDMVVSAVLMSMGMMMVPPAVVSLPFKLAFFVVVDGWGMVANALVRGYQGGG